MGAVALAGVLLAVVLGWLVARTALIPLNDLTDTVEDLAETTDVTRRLQPGRPDELGRLRRTFNRLLEALESSRRAQSQLVLDASHELRTPLTSLRTNLEVIRRVDELSDEDRSVLVDDVLVQLQELTDIVGDLAELARGDRGPASREPLRLDLLVQDEVAVQNTHGRSKDVHFDLAAEPCWVVASDDGLRRAVGNLLDNARKWSPAGQPVEVECRDGLVAVHDHGPGIAAEDLPHIFDRFYRSPAARGLPGSGLGLAIVAQVVKAEGGSIVAENDPGGGARMSMRLPTVAGPVETPPERHRLAASASVQPFSSRVLMERQPAPKVRGTHWYTYPRWWGVPAPAKARSPLSPRRGVPSPLPVTPVGADRPVPAGVSPFSTPRTCRGCSHVVRASALGDELDPVAEGVVDVGAFPRGPVGVGAHRHAGGAQGRHQRRQVADDERRVGLAGRTEVLLDAEMHRHRPVAEPAAAPRRQRIGLGHADQAEQRRVEGFGLSLPAGRHGQLHVVEPDDLEAHRRLLWRERPGSRTPRPLACPTTWDH